MSTNLQQNKKTVVVRIPKDVHRNLKIIAAAEETTMIKILTKIIKEYFDSEAKNQGEI